MEELIPLVFFILWFLLGGLGSKKKREQAQRRAEAERRAREAAARARAEQRRTMRESRDADERITFSDSRTTLSTTSSSSSSSDGETGTALDMVPDELWNILTGGAPRPTGPSRPAPRMPEPEPYESESGGWVTSPPWDEEDAVHSIEGVSAEERGEDVYDYDDEADRIARARYEDLRATTFDDRPSRDSIAVRQDETSDRRHIEFHDALLASEIGSAGAQARRPHARDRLGLGNMDDVRRAIVLAEILGKPKSLRY